MSLRFAHRSRFSPLAVLSFALLAIGSRLVPEAAGQVSMQTILANGPVSNRLNVVVLSEGYTSGQLPQFLVDVTNAVNALWAHQPYQEYQGYFNVFAIEVASPQSGSDHPSYGSYVSTYFNSTYDLADRLITIPPNFADSNYSHGQGRVDALLQTNMPNCNLAILLVNDYTDGGSDGFNKTAIASIGYDAPEILTHETGHVLANLGDEYTNANPTFPATEEPNTTQQTNRLLIKWKAWIADSTPVPTPATSAYSSLVGLFQGAHYHATGWYRPQLDCLMRDLYVPFCDICREALILAIYQKVRPVDACSPASTNLAVSSSAPLTFSLSLLQPATHNLVVQWSTNNVALPGATNAAFTVSPAVLGSGKHTVSALVRDDTSSVRMDPTNLLAQTVTWTLNVSLVQLHLDSPLWLTGGNFAFRVAGNASQGVVVQGSTDLSNWTNLATNSLVAGQFWFTNSSVSASPRTFYRAFATK